MSVDQKENTLPPRRLTKDLLKQTKELRDQLEVERKEHQASQKALQLENQVLRERMNEMVKNHVQQTLALKNRWQAKCDKHVKKERDHWEEKIEAKDEYIQRLEDQHFAENEDLCNTAQIYKDQVQSLLKTLNLRIEQSNSLQKLLQEEQNKNEALNDQLKEEIKAKTAAQQEAVQLQKQRDKLQAKLGTLTCVLDQKRHANQEAMKKNKAINNQVKEEAKAKTAAQKDVEQLQRERDNLQTKVLSLTAALDQESHEKEQLQAKVQEKERTIDSLTADVSSLRFASNKEKTKISASSQKQIDSLQKTVLKTEQEMTCLKETHEKQMWTMKLKVQEISEALNTSKSNNSALKPEHEELQETTERKQEKRVKWWRKWSFWRGAQVHPMSVASV
uniref:Uncharacterized protein n=1 Tax=Knipowitschia caucasica TaxID=637954 RepID=A0AAV2JBN6_KNICA